MSLYILRWNPAISSYKMKYHIDLIGHIKNGEQPMDFNWSIREHQKLKKDDVFILQQVGTDNDGIAMIGKFKGKCYEEDSWRKDGTKIYYADMWILDAFACDSENPLPAELYEKLFPEIKWHGGPSGIEVEAKLAKRILDAIKNDLLEADLWAENEFEDFMACDFEKKVANFSSEMPTAEDLADGKILLSLKEKYLADKREDRFVQLLLCLRNSVVRVPMKIEISDEAKKIIQENIDAGKTEGDLETEISYYPILVANDKEGIAALPVFSTDDETGDNYEDNYYQIIEMPFLECIDIAQHTEGCSAIILDVFDNPFLIDEELMDTISQIPDNIYDE